MQLRNSDDALLEFEFVGHVVQSFVVDAIIAEYFPTSHSVQSLSFIVTLYFPALQLKQVSEKL